jgi:hypothetical protein
MVAGRGDGEGTMYRYQYMAMKSNTYKVYNSITGMEPQIKAKC